MSDDQVAVHVKDRPLCVDLDGTLVCSDLLVESIFALLNKNVLYFFCLPFWLLKGKAHFKQRIAEQVDIDPSLLPYHDRLMNNLKVQHKAGRRLILATATNEKIANKIALFLGIFDDVYASDAITNLSGFKKLEQLINRFGPGGYDYVGNSKIDIPIWEHAGEALLVNTSRRLQSKVENVANVTHIFKRDTENLLSYVKAIRLHQWLKNLLVFVPLITSHKIFNLILFMNASIAFIAFGLCASSVYLLNDLIDLQADRQHNSKRLRPLAAGQISIIKGLILIPILLISALSVSLFLPYKFVTVIALYYIATLLYSFRLKQAMFLDVLVLAGLYTLRIFAGGAAVYVTPSFWLIAFSMFLFLSLAMVKRYTELYQIQVREFSDAPGRSYRKSDFETLSQLGISSAYMSVLVLALYIDSENIKELYTHPEIIWLLCPLHLYFVSRIWFMVRRNQLHDDPIVFLLRDKQSLWLVVLGLLLILIASA